MAVAAGWLLFALVLGAGFRVYARLCRRVRDDGGAVNPEGFQLADLLTAFVLASTFGALVVKSALHRQEAVAKTAKELLNGSLTFAFILAGLAAFLHFRGLRLVPSFGLNRLKFSRLLGWALLLLAAVAPLIALANQLAVLLLKGQAAPQPLVDLFGKAAAANDIKTVSAIVIAGVVVAPLCEEFLFRGYFYGVGKKFFGPLASGLFTALLFAAYHANLASLPGLFVLACAFTLAYERTGSLLLPMCMHALFNATSLTILYLRATSGGSR